MGNELVTLLQQHRKTWILAVYAFVISETLQWNQDFQDCLQLVNRVASELLRKSLAELQTTYKKLPKRPYVDSCHWFDNPTLKWYKKLDWNSLSITAVGLLPAMFCGRIDQQTESAAMFDLHIGHCQTFLLKVVPVPIVQMARPLNVLETSSLEIVKAFPWIVKCSWQPNHNILVLLHLFRSVRMIDTDLTVADSGVLYRTSSKSIEA